MKYKFGLVWIRIPMEEMEEFKFCYHGPGDPIQEFLRIYWSRIRPYSQKWISSSWLVLQVGKSTKILDVRKYLFQMSKQSYSITVFLDKDFPDFT
jgi:hypothetical protein